MDFVRNMTAREMMYDNRTVLNERTSVLNYPNAVYTISVLSKLIKDFATYFVSTFAVVRTKQRLVNKNVYRNRYRISAHRKHSELCRMPVNSERAHSTRTVAVAPELIRHRSHAAANASNNCRNLVISIKTICFIMLFAGVTALPPVIRIGEYTGIALPFIFVLFVLSLIY